MPIGTIVTLSAAEGLVGGTLATDVLFRLRGDITSCVLKPGQKLRFEMLRSIYCASFSTLREALSTLKTEGLVVAEGQRGFTVAPVSAGNLIDLTNSRVLIEREVLRLSIENGKDAWEDGLLAAFHRLDRMERRFGDSSTAQQEWIEIHRGFHDALAAACGSPVLLSIRANLFELAHRYRRLAALSRNRIPRGKSAEHRAILEAAIARNLPDALVLIEGHIRQTSQYVLTWLAAEPGAAGT